MALSHMFTSLKFSKYNWSRREKKVIICFKYASFLITKNIFYCGLLILSENLSVQFVGNSC